MNSSSFVLLNASGSLGYFTSSVEFTLSVVISTHSMLSTITTSLAYFIWYVKLFYYVF